MIMLVPFKTPGVNDTGHAYAHIGFLTAYNAVASNVISVIGTQLKAHPGYSIVSTGQLFSLIRQKYANQSWWIRAFVGRSHCFHKWIVPQSQLSKYHSENVHFWWAFLYLRDLERSTEYNCL